MSSGVHVVDDENQWICDGDPNHPAEIERRREWIAAQRAKVELNQPDAEVFLREAKAVGDAALKAAAGLRPPQAREKLEEAERSYSGVVRKLPSSWTRESSLTTDLPVLFANCALARLKLASLPGAGIFTAEKMYKKCVQDCRAALDLKPDYEKALYRRARANLGLACKPFATLGSPEQQSLLDKIDADLARVLELNSENTEAALWRKVAPVFAAEFEGHRLPDAPQDVRTVAAAIDVRAAAPAGTPPPPWPEAVRVILQPKKPAPTSSSTSEGPAALGSTAAVDVGASSPGSRRSLLSRASAMRVGVAAAVAAAGAAAILARRYGVG